ncbi:DUF2330 domain-containing protein [Flaviaesturariibacter terrae]
MEKSLTLDPRWFQAGFQLLFLAYGCLWLHWPLGAAHCIASVGGCVLFQYVFESARQRRFLPLRGAEGFGRWGFSVLISALSLCLLLRCNHWSTSLLAALITVGSKYVLRVGGRHLFNPSAIGIVAVLLFSGDAWLSPGQWGSGTVLFFSILTLGTIVVTRVQKLDVSLAFLAGYAGLMAWRQLWVLGWPADHFVHTLSTGSLLLFTFFMISDPRSTPAHPVARVAWGFGVGALAFYLAAFRWWYNTPLYVLLLAAPLVPLLDRLLPARGFRWQQVPLPFTGPLRKAIQALSYRKGAALLLLFTLMAQHAFAFCGFYVSKADGTLKNKTSQVILVRDGDRNVITMYNDFKGSLRDFAMLVPVPVVLKESDIHVVDPKIFQTLNDYSGPRLVEYYDEDPCVQHVYEERAMTQYAPAAVEDGALQKGVRIEARYQVGEYDILILSARQSAGLSEWLLANGYKIPAAAREVLEPYIKSNLKFFVVKVNETALKRISNNFLRPLQISFRSPKFMLPIRLGMANADGDQDLIVYAFTRQGRVECSNYRTAAMPTGQEVPLFVQKDFNRFYSLAFNRSWQQEGRAVAMLEYAWNVSPANYFKCDPCTGTVPSLYDLVQAGVWWVQDGSGPYADVFFTRLHVRYNRQDFPQDLLFQATPNQEPFQARYVLTHAAHVDPSCPQRAKYFRAVRERRQRELRNLQQLTGTRYHDWAQTDGPEEALPAGCGYAALSRQRQDNGNWALGFYCAGWALAAAFTAIGLRRLG